MDSEEQRDALLMAHAPLWIEAVDARAGAPDWRWIPEDALSTDVRSFHDQPELLYVALDYAARRGVPVVLVPYQ